MARSPSRLALCAALYCGLAVLQGLHGLELSGRKGEDREWGRGMRGDPERQPLGQQPGPHPGLQPSAQHGIQPT